MTNQVSILKSLIFANQQKLTTQTENTLNTVMFYDDVYIDPLNPTIKVDALVTFYEAKNAQVAVFDSPNLQYNNTGYLQPNVYISKDDWFSTDKESYVSFNVQFIKDGSLTNTSLDASKVSILQNQVVYNGSKFYEEIVLKNILWESYDIDGLSVNSLPSESRQYVQTTQFDPDKVITYPNPESSALVVSNPDPSTIRVQSAYGGNATQPVGSLEYDQHRVSVGMQDTSYFNIKFGEVNNRYQYTAAYSLNFAPGPIFDDKFYVVDYYKKTFVYGDTGLLIDNWDLRYKSKSPMDVTSNKAGTFLWTIDKYKNVNKYDTSGVYIGSWKSSTGSNPEGIAYDDLNNSIWTANQAGLVDWYSGAGSHISGSYGSNGTFQLNLGYKNKLKGIVSDSNNLWVVIDGNDQIRKYSIQRNENNPIGLNLIATWDLPDQGSPTGITLNPNEYSDGDIWVVDEKYDNITNYTGLRGAASGSTLNSYVQVNLVYENKKPQGLTNPGINANPFISAPEIPLLELSTNGQNNILMI